MIFKCSICGSNYLSKDISCPNCFPGGQVTDGAKIAYLKNKYKKGIFKQTVLFFLTNKISGLTAEQARAKFINSEICLKWGDEFTVGDLFELSSLIYGAER